MKGPQVSALERGTVAAAVRSDPPRAVVRAERRMWLWAAAALLAFMALSIGFSLARAPWWDEGVFADVALNFRNHAYLGSSTLYPQGYLAWPDADHYTYWQFPLYLIALGVWLRAVPFAIEWIRAFSVLWGVIYVCCWFLVVRALSRNERIALLVASVVALDYAVVAAASDGRMEMMCAALGQAALASYLCLRESHWNRAIVLAALFGAASLFCHPMGLVTNACIAAVVFMDWRRIRWSGALAALLPYALGGALWLAYISKAPRVFLAQTKAASGYRVVSVGIMLRNVGNDLYLRYYGLYFSSMHGVNKLKVASLAFAVIGTLGLAFHRRFRADPLGKVLLILACIGYVAVALIDNQKFPLYFIYTIPFMTACGAVWVTYCWASGGPWRWISAVLLSLSVGATLSGFAYKILENDYVHLYNPAIAAIREAVPPGGFVMGGSELGFALGFGSNLVDDRYLGYFSGRTPDVYVENQYYGGMRGTQLSEAWAASRVKLNRLYHLTFKNDAYKVYTLNRK